ncbi:MAG: tryptophan synthase subunit alpha [Candidatus Omnitrophota bacterium]
MKNRIDQKFKELRAKKKKAFIAFITAGDPDLKTTKELVLAFEKAGVDIVELGVPFSDPLADGPTIQNSSFRALKKKTTLRKILKAVKEIREKSQIPIALMTYYNPVFCFPQEKLMPQARISGVDGFIVPDLPPEEATGFIREAKRQGIATIFLLTPTTTPKRARLISKVSTGFIYYVSLTGVTGARKILPKALRQDLQRIKRMTSKPICVGFGISTNAQARSVASLADGVIVGSAIVDKILKNTGKKNLVKNVARTVSQLSKLQ